MHITVIANPRTPHQRLHQQSLLAGLKKLGIKGSEAYYGQRINTRFVSCWGWKIGKKLRSAGHEVLVMERGYIGDRFKYTSLGWNGLNGYAEFPNYEDSECNRLPELDIELKPWKYGGQYALILGQVPNDASLQGKNMVPWYQAQAAAIGDHYKIPVLFREHPDIKKRGLRQNVKGLERSSGTLQEALSNALFTVCYNSNSSVDSIIEGVPCVVGDRGSMAYELCSKSIYNLVRPERAQWLRSLAMKQWRIEEIASGKALEKHICKLM